MSAPDPGKAVYIQPVDGLTNWTTLNNSGPSGVRLPVGPIANFTRNSGGSYSTTTLAKAGEVISFQGQRLTTISFQTLIPDALYYDGNTPILPTFAHQPTGNHPFLDPRVLANLLYYLATRGIIFRLLITDPGPGGDALTSKKDVDINMFAVLEDYSDWEEDGNDVWVNLSFRQWRPVELRKTTRKVTSSTATKKKTPAKQPSRPGAKKIPATYKVKVGDSLVRIAFRVLGDSRRYRDIMKLNGIKAGQQIKVGQILKMPRK